MSTITVPPEERTTPAVGDLLDGKLWGDRRRPRPTAQRALRFVHVPLAISAGVNALFFVVYWVPELAGFPGHNALLGQLAPLASQELTSRSEPVVVEQSGHLGLAAAYLLLAGLLLPPLARSRFWLARLALVPLTYVGAACVAVTILVLLVRGQLSSGAVGVVLGLVWVLTAAVTTWNSAWVDPASLPGRPSKVGWLLAAFVLVSTVPVAVGRRVFAPDLQTAAASLMHNDFALRWAALFTPVSALVYVGGVAVGTLIWAGYLLWPPRAATKVTLPLGLALLALACLLVLGPAATRAGEQRAELLRTGSPSDEIAFTCGAWARRPPGAPAQTLMVSGLTCRRVTVFSGYAETSNREVPYSLSPVIVSSPRGARIPGKLVAAEYGETLVVAGTSRVDNRADQVLGLRLTDAAQLWRFDCPDAHTLELGFADVPPGTAPTVSRVTGDFKGATVVVDCGAGEVRLDPQTGKVR